MNILHVFCLKQFTKITLLFHLFTLQLIRRPRQALSGPHNLINLLVHLLRQCLTRHTPLTHLALLREALQRSTDWEGQFREGHVLIQHMQIVRQQSHRLGHHCILSTAGGQVQLRQLQGEVDLRGFGGGGRLLLELAVLHESGQ